jgi:phosphopantothenoylcysteine synthetase/decarboxylase
LFFPLLFFYAFKFRVFYKTLNHFSALFFSLEFFFILEQTRSTLLRRERERERDGWCVYSSQRRRWQNDDSDDDEHYFYDDDQEKEELARRRLGGAKKEIESKENG